MVNIMLNFKVAFPKKDTLYNLPWLFMHSPGRQGGGTERWAQST